MSRARSDAPSATPAHAGAGATSYGDLCDVLQILQRGMEQAETFWLRHLQAPAAAVNQAIDEIMDEGCVTPGTAALLAPHASKRESLRTEQMRALLDAADSRAWKRHRIAIVPDPDLWRDMGQIKDGDTLSADIFKWLPYENPYIHLPTPMVLPTADPAKQHRVFGAFLRGVRRDEHGQTRLCSTSDPRAFTIVFKLAGAITDLHGRTEYLRAEWDTSLLCPDTVWTNMILWFLRPEMTFGEMAEVSTRNFVNHDEGGGRTLLHDTTSSAQAALDVVRPLLAFVNYLCCSNADLQVRTPTRDPRAKRRRSNAHAAAPVMVRAGFQIGAAIRAWRTETRNSTATAATGRTVRPHPRRAHFHRFRYGPGRALLGQPKYLPMNWINWRARTEDVTVKPAK